jgi:RNA polymerase sigma-70 factor (ECF subfamily)
VSKPLNPPELVDRVKAGLSGRRTLQRKPPSGGEKAEYFLVQAAVAGNRAAFEVLIQQYRERLTSRLRRSGKSPADAEDLASAAFVRAYERLDQFRGEASFYTWLHSIAFNQTHHDRRPQTILSLDHLTWGDESLLPPPLAVADRVGEDVSQRSLQTHVQEAVSCIPKPYRKMLKWHFLKGMPYGKMARRLKIPSGTVMSRMFKAKRLLREAWSASAGRQR